MFKRLGHALVLCALLIGIGAHWLVLQSVAWTAMLADNLRTAPLPQAVGLTFDGRHPCSLCKHIAAGKKSEQKSEFPLQLKKLQFLSATPRFAFSAPAQFPQLVESRVSWNSVCGEPPTPPPRAAAL